MTEIEPGEYSHKIGEQIGNYRLDKPLGSGGFSEVWQAFEPNSDRRVAVKIFLDRITRDPAWNEIREEPKKQPDHERIVPIYYSQLDPDKGPCYIVMRLMEGGTLEDHIRAAGRLQVAEAIGIVRDVIEGLEYAHSKGIIHRDLKPSNILFNSQRRAALADFGIAKTQKSNSRTTVFGAVKGTPAYMSPEQGEGIPLTQATDIYSLGTILYEMICGKLPFDGPTDTAIMIARSKQEPPPPHQVVPDVPDRVEKVVLNCLNRNLEHRYPDCNSLTKALNWATAVPSGAQNETKKTRATAFDIGSVQGYSEPVRKSAEPVQKATVQAQKPTGKYLLGGGLAAIILAGAFFYFHGTKLQTMPSPSNPKSPSTTPVAPSPPVDAKRRLQEKNWAQVSYEDPDFVDCMDLPACLARKKQRDNLAAVGDWSKADAAALNDCMSFQPCVAEQRRRASSPSPSKPKPQLSGRSTGKTRPEGKPEISISGKSQYDH